MSVPAESSAQQLPEADPTLPPVRYYPFEGGRWEVKPGLFKLGVHTVHGRAEHRVFLLDSAYERAIRNLVSVRPHLHRHYLTAGVSPRLRGAFLRFAVARLAFEWPSVFGTDEDVSGPVLRLTNRWLGWTARIDVEAGSVVAFEKGAGPLAHLVADVEPVDAFDFVALNVAEDLSLIARDPVSDDEWLPALHICAPHHWDPRDKVGRSFRQVHAPVGDAAPLRATGHKLMRAAVEQGPYLRFAWGLASNDRLNHHPDADHGGDRDASNPQTPEAFAALWIRVERQILWGFPEAHGALFTIRPIWYPLSEVLRDVELTRRLASNLASMGPESLVYKSLEQSRDAIVAWMQGIAAASEG